MEITGVKNVGKAAEAPCFLNYTKKDSPPRKGIGTLIPYIWVTKFRLNDWKWCLFALPKPNLFKYILNIFLCQKQINKFWINDARQIINGCKRVWYTCFAPWLQRTPRLFGRNCQGEVVNERWGTTYRWDSNWDSLWVAGYGDIFWCCIFGGRLLLDVFLVVAYFGVYFWVCCPTLPESNIDIAPENMPNHPEKERIVFQASMFMQGSPLSNKPFVWFLWGCVSAEGAAFSFEHVLEDCWQNYQYHYKSSWLIIDVYIHWLDPNVRIIIETTLPETNSSNLKMDGWNTIVSYFQVPC